MIYANSLTFDIGGRGAHGRGISRALVFRSYGRQSRAGRPSPKPPLSASPRSVGDAVTQRQTYNNLKFPRRLYIRNMILSGCDKTETRYSFALFLLSKQYYESPRGVGVSFPAAFSFRFSKTVRRANEFRGTRFARASRPICNQMTPCSRESYGSIVVVEREEKQKKRAHGRASAYPPRMIIVSKTKRDRLYAFVITIIMSERCKIFGRKTFVRSARFAHDHSAIALGRVGVV